MAPACTGQRTRGPLLAAGVRYMAAAALMVAVLPAAHAAGTRATPASDIQAALRATGATGSFSITWSGAAISRLEYSNGTRATVRLTSFAWGRYGSGAVCRPQAEADTCRQPRELRLRLAPWHKSRVSDVRRTVYAAGSELAFSRGRPGAAPGSWVCGPLAVAPAYRLVLGAEVTPSAYGLVIPLNQLSSETQMAQPPVLPGSSVRRFLRQAKEPPGASLISLSGFAHTRSGRVLRLGEDSQVAGGLERGGASATTVVRYTVNKAGRLTEIVWREIASEGRRVLVRSLRSATYETTLTLKFSHYGKPLSVPNPKRLCHN